MKRFLVGLAIFGTLITSAYADFDYAIKSGVNIIPNKINQLVPCNLGAEVSYAYKDTHIMSVSADYFINEKKNLPVMLNYKFKTNTNFMVGVGAGMFVDTTKTPAVSASISTKIDKNWFLEVKGITRLSRADRNNFILFSLGYQF